MFDFDILFTTDNKTVIDSVYQNERVTLYDVPKPKKKPNLTDDDLFTTDTFSFGQQIGPLTNISSTIYSLLPLFPEDSKEYEVLMSRLKQCCVNQSKQIDKSKIGIPVKCIPDIWVQRNKIEDTDTEEQKKEKKFYESIRAEKKPYFFRYKYTKTDKDYKEFINQREEACRSKFGSTVGLKELFSIPEEELTDEQKAFIDYYYRRIPVNDTDCVMNKICHYIENIDFGIKKKVHSSYGFDYTMLQTEGFQPNKKIYEQVKQVVATHIKKWAESKKAVDKTKAHLNFNKDAAYIALKEDLSNISTNDEVIVNHLITLFYEEKPSYNKNIIWDNYGKIIYNILRAKTKVVYFPQKNEKGSINFLRETYSIERVDIDEIPEDKTYDREFVMKLEEDIDMFDNIKEETGIND